MYGSARMNFHTFSIFQDKKYFQISRINSNRSTEMTHHMTLKSELYIQCHVKKINK